MDLVTKTRSIFVVGYIRDINDFGIGISLSKASYFSYSDNEKAYRSPGMLYRLLQTVFN